MTFSRLSFCSTEKKPACTTTHGSLAGRTAEGEERGREEVNRLCSKRDVKGVEEGEMVENVQTMREGGRGGI